MKVPKKTSTANQRFRPGRSGECESQLWRFPGLTDEDAPQVYWIAAESLEAALGYLRQRHDDFIITEARFLGMIPLLSGSPLD